jgi:hypothetical protein
MRIFHKKTKNRTYQFYGDVNLNIEYGGCPMSMMGLLISTKECMELEYLIRRELEEMLLDLEDQRLDGLIRKAIEERYQLIFRLYSRVASPKDLVRYVRNKRQHH